MEIFILRHGRAEPYTASDHSRQLVESGRHDVSRVLQSSVEDLLAVQQVWASPLIRAQQTAEIALQFVDVKLFQTTDFLAPDIDPQAVIHQLQLCGLSSLLLVSHQPLVSRLMEWMCGAEPRTHPMDTAALACIDTDLVGAGAGYLRWLRHP